MSEVDPFIIPIPKAFRDDPEVHAWAMYLHRWCHDMWIRSGGGDDTLSAVVDVIVGESDTITSGGSPTTPVWGDNDWQYFATP